MLVVANNTHLLLLSVKVKRYTVWLLKSEMAKDKLELK